MLATFFIVLKHVICFVRSAGISVCIVQYFESIAWMLIQLFFPKRGFGSCFLKIKISGPALPSTNLKKVPHECGSWQGCGTVFISSGSGSSILG